MNSTTITVRTATKNDLDQIATLFFETIVAINSKDYNPEQIKLWSSRDAVFWQRRFNEQYFLVAEQEGIIIGFSSLTDSGYLDFMYIHKDYQRMGVAKKLLKTIENHALSFGLWKIESHVSITARPFFDKQGFSLIREQRKKLGGITFINYAMQKKIGTLENKKNM